MSNRIFLVPHTHYDAIWVFTKEDYFYINIDLILKKALKLMEKSGDFKFIIEQTYLLEEIERRYPEMFEKIREFVKKGRIEITSGEYLMLDLMLPQEETLVRNILYGRNYLKEKFGIKPEVVWQADSFGLNAQLPQIYSKSGYRFIAFRRGCYEKKPSEFIWKGLNGSEIVAHFMPLGYRAGLYLDKLKDSYEVLKECASSSVILMPAGSGVTLPQEEIIEAVRKWNRRNRNKIIIATPAEFFRELKRERKNLVIRKGEMYSSKYSEVFPDVSSSRMWIKLNFRDCESNLISLERFSSINCALGGNYYGDELRQLWKKLLFVAVHDGIPGTGMDSAYDEIKFDLEFVRNHIEELMPRVLKDIVEKCNGDFESDIVVFNPSSFEVKNWVEVDLEFEKGEVKKIEGVVSGNEFKDVEIISFTRYDDESLRSAKIGFIAEVPPLGFRSYRVVEEKRNDKGNFIRIRGNTIENKFFHVEFNPENGLIRVLKNNELIAEGNELVIEEEHGDLYYHKSLLDKPLKTESGEGIKYGIFKMDRFYIDKSPLRRVINVEGKYYSLRWPYRLTEKLKPKIFRHNFLDYRKKIIVYRDLDRIDFITEIDNRHPRLRLRVKFNADFSEDEYICESQFGNVVRKGNMFYENTENWFEKPSGVYPSLRWIHYGNGRKGFTLINKGIPENEVRDNNVYLTLLRSVEFVSADGSKGPSVPLKDAREFKKYRYEYSLMPDNGKFDVVKSCKEGLSFNYKLIAFQYRGKVKEKFSFAEIDPDNVILTGLKKSEFSDNLILRVYECSGKKNRARIHFHKRIKKVDAVNLMEEWDKSMDGRIKKKGDYVEFEIEPYEIVSLKVDL